MARQQMTPMAGTVTTLVKTTHLVTRLCPVEGHIVFYRPGTVPNRKRPHGLAQMSLQEEGGAGGAHNLTWVVHG